VGEALAELPIAVRDCRAKGAVLPLDAIGCRASACGGGLRVEEEDERAIRREIGDGDVQLEDPVDAEPATDALVRKRGVEVPVTHDIGAVGERRADHSLGQLGARGREERRLRPGRGLVAVQQQIADVLAERCPTWLANGDDIPPLRRQMLGEQRRLGRLPGAVHTLEGDEHRGLTIRRVRAIVTGGAGFVGSHVVDALLARGDEVTVVDDLSTGQREFVDPAAQLIEHDIREPLVFEADVVFHLAAQADVGTSVEKPLFDAEVNVLGTLNVLEAARATGAAVVFTSTGGAIYGDVTAPAAEDAPLRPVSPYGMAKLAGEAYVGGWRRVHGLQTAVVRLANVYGPRQSAALEGGVVAIFLERMAAGEETLIFGDGEQSRDFVYVGDVVAAILAAAQRDEGVFNVGTGVETTVLDLVERVGRLSGRGDFEPQFAPRREGEVERNALDPALAAERLGFRAERTIEAGLDRMLAGQD
jgi:UDP-glucose 4-epimerase